MSEDYKVEKVFSYIISHDTGFAPNPFWGRCSLACCKPAIRRSIGNHWNPNQHNWIIGISPKHRGNELIYMMRVDDCITFPEYYVKYPQKRPDFSKDQIHICGDNIYKPLNGKYEQLRSRHSKHPFRDSWSIDYSAMKHDLGGQFVLLSDNFIYFGKETFPLEGNLRELIPGRGHRCNFSKSVINELEELINRNKEQIRKGSIMSNPHRWRED